MPPSKDDRDIDAALRHCAAEPVHAPGHIQPHGALIAVDGTSLQIEYASETTGRVLRAPHDQILGKPIGHVFGQRTRRKLAGGILQACDAQASVDLGPLDFGAMQALVTVAPAGALTLLEFEAVDDTEQYFLSRPDDLERSVDALFHAPARQQLFDASVTLLRRLTGYDRVLVYALDSECNGTVVSEEVGEGTPSLLGLKFPAWDIPPQVRKIMRQHSLRHIADVNAATSPLHAADPRATELDLTNAHLRGVSAVHCEYLRNMGVRSSISLNIVLRGDLWGTISLHHGAPRYPGPRVRRACQHFAEVFKVLLEHSAPNQFRTIGAWKPDTPALADMMDGLDADGVALIDGDSVESFGRVPPVDQLRRMCETHAFSEGVTATPSLRNDAPDLAALLGPSFAGLLATGGKDGTRCFLFRVAQEGDVSWAGPPEKLLDHHQGGPRLRPRTSFESHRGVQKGRSRPWTPEQLQMAEDLQWLLSNNKERHVKGETKRALAGTPDDLSDAMYALTDQLKSLCKPDPGG